MAFEAYLKQGEVKPRGRRLMVAASLAVHGAMLALAIIFSFWHVEELSPPLVSVTFMSAPPPAPPPPPPPPRKRTPDKPKAANEIVHAKPDTVVPHREEPPTETETREEVAPTDLRGTIGGTHDGPGDFPGDLPPVATETKFVPPNVGTGQRMNGLSPVAPAALARAGMQIGNLVKICVAHDGSIKDITLVNASDPLWDDAVLAAVSAWKFKPYTVNGRAVPFCYLSKFVLQPTP